MKKKYVFVGCSPILGEVHNSIKSGQNPRIARWVRKFASVYTGEIVQCTDLEQAKNKRRRKFVNFYEKYKKSVVEGSVTIFSGVANTDNYPDFSKFISNLKKKFKLKKISILGYVWTRDVGDVKFKRHVHFFIATSKISAQTFHKLFSKKRHNKFNIEIPKKFKGMTSYLKNKEIYSDRRQRSWGSSKFYLSPPPIPVSSCLTTKTKNESNAK